MTYRNDHDAALARIAALEAELAATQRELSLSRAPPLPGIPALPGLPPIRPPRTRTSPPPEFSETEGWEAIHAKLREARRRREQPEPVLPMPPPAAPTAAAVLCAAAIFIGIIVMAMLA